MTGVGNNYHRNYTIDSGTTILSFQIMILPSLVITIRAFPTLLIFRDPQISSKVNQKSNSKVVENF